MIYIYEIDNTILMHHTKYLDNKLSRSLKHDSNLTLHMVSSSDVRSSYEQISILFSTKLKLVEYSDTSISSKGSRNSIDFTQYEIDYSSITLNNKCLQDVTGQEKQLPSNSEENTILTLRISPIAASSLMWKILS